MVDVDAISATIKECDELCRILSASRKTAEKHLAESKLGKAISDI
jgi:hypothetical protein